MCYTIHKERWKGRAMQINDLVDIKLKNVKSILDVIRFGEAVTKKDIAAATGLSFATVSNLCNELRDLDVIENTKASTARIGRTPSSISFRRDRFFTVALDFRLENVIGFAIVTIRNEIYYKTSLDTTLLASPMEIVRYAKEEFDKTVKMLRLENATFLRVGAAVPAIHDAIDGRLKTSTIATLDNFPLKDALQTVFGIRAYVDNVTKFSAFSVYSRTHASHPIVCLDVSQGVGVGVMVNGALLRGVNGYGSEIAHVPVGRADEPCAICGRCGCAETLLSVSGMVSRLEEIPEGAPLLLRWQRFVDIMHTGTPRTSAIAREIGLELGRLATILINLFDPCYFSISGYITDIYDLIHPYVQEEVNARSPMSVERGLKVELVRNVFDGVYMGIGEALYESWNPFTESDKAKDATRPFPV